MVGRPPIANTVCGRLTANQETEMRTAQQVDVDKLATHLAEKYVGPVVVGFAASIADAGKWRACHDHV